MTSADLAATASGLTKRRTRFRGRSAKILTNIFRQFDRLEALAGVQSYEISTSDLTQMKMSVSARSDRAFDALKQAADLRKAERPDSTAFAFDAPAPDPAETDQ